MPVGQEIKVRREQHGLSLGDLARLSGVSKGYLSEIESNPAAKPSAATLLKIALALGTSVAELLGQRRPQETAAIEISEALRKYADQEAAKGHPLLEAEIQMLAGINHRGRVPQTEDDWRFIHESIKMRSQGREQR